MSLDLKVEIRGKHGKQYGYLEPTPGLKEGYRQVLIPYTERELCYRRRALVVYEFNHKRQPRKNHKAHRIIVHESKIKAVGRAAKSVTIPTIV